MAVSKYKGYIMKTIRIIATIFFVLFMNMNSLGASIEDDYNEYKKLLSEKSFEKAFPLIKKLCLEDKILDTCYTLAVYYKTGEIVNKNLEEAYNLCVYVAENTDTTLRDATELLMAEIIEEGWGDAPDNMNYVMHLYHKLQSSKVKDISEIAKKRFKLVHMYNFLLDLSLTMNEFANKKINYEILEDKLSKLDASCLTDKGRELFAEYKNSALKTISTSMKAKNTKLETSINVFVKALTRDATVIGDITSIFATFFKTNKLSNDMKISFINFTKQLHSDGVNGLWIERCGKILSNNL